MPMKTKDLPEYLRKLTDDDLVKYGKGMTNILNKMQRHGNTPVESIENAATIMEMIATEMFSRFPISNEMLQ